MIDSMVLFANAINDRINGSNEKFFFIDENEKLFEHNIERYYKKPFPKTKLEKKLFSLCGGKILDVGSATGNYFSEIKNDDLTGIESCRAIFNIAKSRNINNIICKDIFKYKTKIRFDTILLLENNLGMGGNIKKTNLLLKKLLRLLNKDGKILFMLSKRSKQDFYVIKLNAFYNGKKGKNFFWVNMSLKYLKKMCEENNSKLNLIDQDNSSYLVEIINKR
jgi:SAM-dependent methyltransferase